LMVSILKVDILMGGIPEVNIFGKVEKSLFL
jgi:hypothetical protein